MERIEPEYAAVGARISRARRSIEMTQDALAACVGLTRASLTNIESGRQRIQLHTLLKVARVLNVSAATLLPDELGLTTEEELPQELSEQARVSILGLLQDFRPSKTL